jgi:hypothetical protein
MAYFLVLELGSRVLVNHCRRHQVAGGFQLKGQDSFRYPGAREPDKLLLAGWVVSQFWVGFGQCIRLGKTVEKTTRSSGISISNCCGVFLPYGLAS